MGVWPAARTSDRRLCACCVMHCCVACPVVRFAAAGCRDPGHGSAVRLGSGVTHTAFIKHFQHSKSPAFWPLFGTTYCHQTGHHSLPTKFSRSYFRWRACPSVRRSQSNIHKLLHQTTYELEYVYILQPPCLYQQCEPLLCPTHRGAWLYL